MFLSAAITELEADGSLLVDLRAQHAPLLRFGPFQQGMRWHRFTEGGWVETALDWGARLANRAHEARDELPVLGYLRHWPREVVEALFPVWYAQCAALQLCAAHASARDLLNANPALFWLLAACTVEQPGCREQAATLLAQPQRALLARLLGLKTVRPAQVRFLRKLVVMEGTATVLDDIRHHVTDEAAVMAARHWPRLPTPLLRLARGPVLLNLRWLRDELASTGNRWMLGQYLERYGSLVRDTSRMLEQLGYDGTDPALIRFTRTPGGLQQLHDVLVRALNDPALSISVNISKAALCFGAPPIPSNNIFHAITTVGELYDEGREMRHCVATRAEDILAGSCYVYRMNLNGERATLQIGIRPSGWVIDEFRRRENAPPSAEAWATAREWLRQANERASGRGFLHDR